MTDLATILAACGLPAAIPEPEVLRADLARIQEKSLATVIANLVNANEPLLSAKADGNKVAIGERGGPSTFTFTIQQSSRDGGGEQKAVPGQSK